MPPKTEMIPLPRSRGKDAYDYLAAHSLIAKVPNIRSSDSFTNPFQYYLSRRLGLRPAYTYYQPFSVGDWAHKYLQFYYEDDTDARFYAELRKFQSSLRDLASQPQLRWSADRLDTEIQKVQDDAEYARAIFLTGIDIQLDSTGRTIRSAVLDHPRLRCLGQELILRVPYGKTELVAQYDLLMYDEDNHTLRVPDLKTTITPPKVRADQCPIEFQTRHYLYILNRMLPNLIQRFNLDPRTTVGSMDHLIVQKPNLKIHDKDIPRRAYEHTLQRGPRAGQTEIRYEKLADTPDPELFRARVRDKMLGTGEYEHEGPYRQDEPMADISYTHFDRLPQGDWDEYQKILADIYSLATRDPYPENFPRNARSMVDRRQPTPYALFYRHPVQAWPRIAREMNMIVDFREPEDHHGQHD